MQFLKRLFAQRSGPSKQQAHLSERGLAVEYCAPLKSKCDCCDDITTTLNRRVKRDGWPYAICRITFSRPHVDFPAKGIFGLGEFGEETTPSQRVAFGVVLRPDGVMLVDATEEVWPNSDLLGAKLTRAEALKHPRKAELFALIDELYLHDEELIAYFRAVIDGAAGACGHCSQGV